MADAVEVNFDGLIGPTHNYAGLSDGNLASARHRNTVSNPRQAALQGLAKMKFLADLGLAQGVLPPQERPDLRMLRRLGFGGADAHVLDLARREAPHLLAACFSASAMWAANAATVSPSADTADGRVHFTPANLVSHFHRSLEASATALMLQAIFRGEEHFAHHAPLPASLHFSDEGAANHMRLAAAHSDPGLEIFIYGRDAFCTEAQGPRAARQAQNATGGATRSESERIAESPSRFSARQSRQASEAVGRLHQLDPSRVRFIRQNPPAIDAGAFHNDVVAVANENVLLYHALAFADTAAALADLRAGFPRRDGIEPIFIEVPQQRVPLEEAVSSYLFNSQLVRLADGTMSLICPSECRDTASTRVWLEEAVAGGSPIRSVHFVDVRQSMNNGGGPACLRLRIVLTGAERSAVLPGAWLNDALYHSLKGWIERRYRDRLAPEDLADPRLIDESRTALDELTQILGIGPVFDFQHEPRLK